MIALILITKWSNPETLRGEILPGTVHPAPKELVSIGLNSRLCKEALVYPLTKAKLPENFFKLSDSNSFFETLWQYYAQEVTSLKWGNSIITNELTGWSPSGKSPTRWEAEFKTFLTFAIFSDKNRRRML